MPKNNRSYTNLVMELDKDAELLKYLPYNRATWQPNTEIKGAGPFRLLYGDVVDEKDQVWIYFTLMGGGDFIGTRGTGRMLSFYTLKSAQNGGASIRPAKIQSSAIASQPFKLAVDGFQVVAIAKYFFVRHGVDQSLKAPITCQDFKGDLITACTRYQAAFESQQAAKQAQAVTTAGTHRGTTPRESSAASSSRRHQSEVSAPSQSSKSPSLAPSVDNARKRHRNMNVLGSIGQPPALFAYTSPFSPTPQPALSPPATRLSDTQRDALVNDYVKLQAKEEELDRRIEHAEKERAEIAAQIAEMEAGLEDATETKATLMDEKELIKADKKRLQATLDAEERLEFGYEAGKRSVETKRRRLEDKEDEE